MLRRTSGNYEMKTCAIEATVHVPYSYECWRALELADRYPEPLRKRYRLPSAPSMLQAAWRGTRNFAPPAAQWLRIPTRYLQGAPAVMRSKYVDGSFDCTCFRDRISAEPAVCAGAQ